MIKKKSMLALLLIAAMLCTCLPVSVLASDAKITYGLFDGAVVDAENIMFGVSDITEAPSVTIGGVAIDSAKITYANGNVTVDATNEGIAFGTNNITVKSADDTIFSGNIVLDKFAAANHYGKLHNFVVNGNTGDDSTKKNTCTLNSDTGYYDYTFHKEQASKDTWCYASELTSGNSNADNAFGVFDFQLKAKINENIRLGFQIFRNTSEGKCNGSADGDSLAYNGYLGGLTTNEAMKLSSENVEYTFDVRIDQPNGKWTIWATKDGGEKMFVKTMNLTADIKNYGFNHARIQVSNRSDLLNSGAHIDTTCSIYKTVTFDQKPLDTFKIDSVKADDVELTANADGAYTLSPVTDTVEVTFNTAITGTVTLGSNSVAVNGGKTAKFSGLNLAASDLALTVPASATTIGVATLGNKFVSSFSVSNEFAVASPVEGGSYKKGGKIFSIYEADKTVSYKLNGTALEKDALAENVKLGNNTLEILVDSTEYKRISFNVTDTVIYGTINGMSTVDHKSSSGGNDGGVSYTRYVMQSASRGVQIRPSENGLLTLRDESSGTNRDTRSLSGRFVFEIDMRFVKPESAASDSADGTIKFMYRDNSTTDNANGLNSGYLMIAENGVVMGSNEQLEYGKWYTFDVVADMVNNKYEIYVDGKLARSFTSNKAYLTADSQSLIQYTYTSASVSSLDLKNAKTYFEVPVGIENVTYGSGTALSNGTAPVSSTAFGVITQLRIPDDQINTTNIQLLVDGVNVATAAAKDTTDANYLGEGTLTNNGTKTNNYEENNEKVYKPLWYSGTKGTKINLTVSVPANAKKGELVIKAGTKVIATDWKNVNVADNGKVTSDTSATPQKLITLSEDVTYPVYFTDNGVYAELSQFGNNIATTIITDGTQSGNTIMKAIAKTNASSFDVSTEDYTITAGEAAVATDVKAVDTTSATTAKVMLWFKNSLKPIVDVVNLK